MSRRSRVQTPYEELGSTDTGEHGYSIPGQMVVAALSEPGSIPGRMWGARIWEHGYGSTDMGARIWEHGYGSTEELASGDHRRVIG